MIVAVFLDTEEYIFTQAERDRIQAVSEAAEQEVRGVIKNDSKAYELL